MQKKNHCFHARVGTDRYRLAFLPLYPQLLHLREIVKRLAVMHKRFADDLVSGSAAPPPPPSNASNTMMERLSRIESVFEFYWQISLEAVGVLANSFAPYPRENCNDDASREYQQLWSAADAEFFSTTIVALKAAFQTALLDLQSLAKEDVSTVQDAQRGDQKAQRGEQEERRGQEKKGEQDEPSKNIHSDRLKQLCRETRMIEAADGRLKQSFIVKIDIEGEQQVAELLFPFSSSRLML